MKKLVTRIETLNNGVVSVGMGCFGDDEYLDTATTQTLLELIEQAGPDDQILQRLVTQAETGQYVSPNLSVPDWGVNDINIWLAPPMAKPAHVCVTNENTEYSSDAKHCHQQFTYEQVRAALKHWRELKELMTREGKEKLIGLRYETVFPE